MWRQMGKPDQRNSCETGSHRSQRSEGGFAEGRRMASAAAPSWSGMLSSLEREFHRLSGSTQA